jgi:hypothetical protein
MACVYIVTENNAARLDTYNYAYRTYSAALAAVREKYEKMVDDQIEQGDASSELYVPENKSGKSYIYIRTPKTNIGIIIHKLPVQHVDIPPIELDFQDKSTRSTSSSSSEIQLLFEKSPKRRTKTD